MRNQKTTARLVTGSEWETIPLGELAAAERNSITDGPFGSKLKTEHYTDAGPRVIRLKNIGDTEFVDAKAHISEAHFATLQKHRVFPGDIVIAALGENPPRSCLVPESLGPAIVKADCIRFKAGTRILPKFLNYVLNAPDLRRHAKEIVHGVGRPRLNLGEIKALPIPVPPLAEQHRIVAEIEKQFTRLDAGVTALRRVQANLKRYRASVIEDTLAVDWPKMQVSEIGEVVTGTTPKPSEDDNYGGYLPFITPADLNAGYHLDSATRHLSSKGAKFARPLPERSVLVTCIGATIGKTGLARFPCATNQQINAFIPHDMAVSAEWAFWMFSSPSGQRQIRENASATTLPILNKTRFGMLRMPVPPLEVQAQLVAEIERKLTIADVVQNSLVRSFTRADKLRLTILETAFTGRLITTCNAKIDHSKKV